MMQLMSNYFDHLFLHVCLFSLPGKLVQQAICIACINLAHSANLPTGLYILPSVISSYVFF